MTAIAGLASGGAWASGTTAGSTISNTATIGYTVGGVQQPDVNSNAASFVVDMLVNMSVAEVGGSATVVVPSAAGQVSAFTVTNTSNSTLDFILAPTQDANGATTAFGGTDAGNATNVHVYVDNGDNVFNPAQDTATYIDQLAADASVKVFVVADIPFGLANGAAIGLTLTATAASGTTASSQGAALVATSGADTPGSMDIVFGDTAGDTDSANDGKYSDDDEYRISSATMLISKIARVLSDPFNGTTNPKPVPGAVIEYCIVMQNTGSVSATGLIVTDTVPAHTTYVAGSIKSAGSVTSGACNSDGVTEDDDASDSGEPDTATGSFGSGVVTVNLATVAASQTLTALFRTTID
jgi:uncharacterized repeat protein (TIGR01451 family)